MTTVRHCKTGISLIALLALLGCGPDDADTLASAKAAVAAKDANTARILLKNYLQTNPKSGEARFMLGLNLLDAGQPESAETELQRALESGHPKALVVPPLAQAMVQTGNAVRLISRFKDEALGDAQAQASLKATLAQAMLAQGDRSGAAAAVDEALLLAPQSSAALMAKARVAAAKGDVAGALQTMDDLLAAHGTDGDAWALKGELLLLNRDGQKPAIEAFAKAVAVKPDQLYALSALVGLYGAQGDMDNAKRYFALLKSAAPTHLITGRHEGTLAYAAGDYARAREIFQGLLRVVPDNPQVLLLAGETEMRLGASVQAETMFAKAATLAPSNPEARRLLARAQLRLGQPAKAITTLGPLVEKTDAGAEDLALAAEARLLTGDAKAADALFVRVARLAPTDPQLRTMVAVNAMGRGNDAAAFNELNSIAAADSGTGADLALISAHMRRGDSDAALRALSSLEKKRPGDTLPAMLRAQILAGKKDLAGARQALEAALKLDPGYVPAAAGLATLDMQENQPERARKRFETVLEAKPGNSRAMLAKANFLSAQGAPRSEVQGLIEGAVKAAAQDIDARVALVAFHFDARNFDAALSSAQAAVDAVPDNVELLELLGRCQMRKNDNNQALRSYARVVTLLPGSPRGYVGTADVYLAMGDLDAAQRNIDRALQLVPGHPESRAQAIMVALTRKQPDAALGIARRMQAERAADATGWILEGEIESRRGRWDAAAAALRQALDKTGADTVPLKLHAALVRGGKASEAAAFAATWLKGHPRDAAFLFHLGDVAQVSGDLAGAEKRYQEALVADPDHVPSLNNLAALHTQQKKPDAVALAERAVRRAPEQPALLDTLAAAYAANNDMPKAIKVQTQAVALAPDEGMLRLALARLYLQADSKAQAKYQLEELARMGQRFAEQGEVAKLLATLGSTAASQ